MLVDVHRYGRKQGVGLAVLEVTRLFVDDALLDPAGRLVPERLRPVARLGGNAYALPGPHTSRDRP